MKKKSAFLVSCSVILLCLGVIVGMTWALFSDSFTVSNHLKSGKLDVTLVRTDLAYSVLDADGVLTTYTTDDELDLTGFTTENVFGINSNDIQIVPGSYFDAELEFRKDSTITFDYSIEIRMSNEVSALAEQLQVTVTHPDGSQTVKMLDELASGLRIDAGTMSPADAAQKFGVRIDFVGNAANNNAQDDSVVFDLVVWAQQATN